MLDLAPRSRALDIFHQRFQEETLPPALSSGAFSRFALETYDAQTLQIGRSAWRARALDEYRSQVAFTDLLNDLTLLGASFDVLGATIRVVRDEARHVEICRRMVGALGGGDQIPGEPCYVNPSPHLARMSRVLRTLIGFLCIGETLSMRLIAAVRDRTEDELAHGVMTCLAADESVHSRFGWILLEQLAPNLSAADRAEIDQLLPFYFGAVEDAVVKSAGDRRSAGGPVSPFGSLDYEARMEAYRESIERDIIGRFEALGLPGERAHRNRTRVRPAIPL
jgi:hypothetical protein